MPENFLIKFDSETGERVDTIPCDDALTPEQAENLLEGGYELVSFDDWSRLIGNADGHEYIKNVVNGGYIVKPAVVPTLEAAKAAKVAELKTLRDAKELEPITVDGMTFDADEKSIMRINQGIIVIGLTKQPIKWALANNAEALVTAENLQGVILVIAMRSEQLHLKYRTLKAMVEAAETVEAVDAVEWEE